MPRPGRFTPGKDPVPIVQEAGWAKGGVWTGAENLAPTGIRSPDRLALSESLYRLSYSGPLFTSALDEGKCLPSRPGGITSGRKTSLPVLKGSWDTAEESKYITHAGSRQSLSRSSNPQLCVVVCRYKVWCAGCMQVQCVVCWPIACDMRAPQPQKDTK